MAASNGSAGVHCTLLLARVSESMCGSASQVLHGCPWLLPKALYVLAVPQVAQPHAAMFTLQTRVQQPQVESEMDKVCRQLLLLST